MNETTTLSSSAGGNYLTARFPLAERIRELRSLGQLNDAVAASKNAIDLFPQSHFFAKILADIYFQQENYEDAFIALSDFLSKIPPNKKLIGEFANRYYRLRRALPNKQLSEFAGLLNESLDQAKINKSVADAAKLIIKPDLHSNPLEQLSQGDEKLFVELLNSDEHFDALVKVERKLEENGADRLIQLLDACVLNRKRKATTYRIDLYFVSLYEKLEKFDNALKIVTELLDLRLDNVAIRSLFRICRLLKNYRSVDDLLAKQPSLTKAKEFNILYELVYYFETKNDFEQLQSVLNQIDKSFAQNLPVLRTLRNFYIRFGMLEDAKRLEPNILALYRGNAKATGKYVDEVAESETELASKVQDLYSQLEHQKQLAAISDLTTGISHELGQPITNIRYTIQFYKRLFSSKLTSDDVNKVFDSILEETERMGGLIRRLSPLTSSKTIIEHFDVIGRINKRVEQESPRLTANKIKVNISPKHTVMLQGDPVKFDQLISNLLLNAIDAISEVKQPRNHVIDIKVENSVSEIRIDFSDTGIGIPIKNRNKIFDPFFSTKPPGKGEGLGLFIVWNLLKMHGGRISVDARYKNGARFVITFPKEIVN